MKNHLKKFKSIEMLDLMEHNHNHEILTNLSIKLKNEINSFGIGKIEICFDNNNNISIKEHKHTNNILNAL